jgi:hypothetical protein
MKLPTGTTTGGLSATAAKGVKRTGQKGLAVQKGFQKGLALLLQRAELDAEGTELTGHDGSSKGLSVGHYINISTEVKGLTENFLGGVKIVGIPPRETGALRINEGRRARMAAGRLERRNKEICPSALGRAPCGILRDGRAAVAYV